MPSMPSCRQDIYSSFDKQVSEYKLISSFTEVIVENYGMSWVTVCVCMLFR